MNMQKLFLYSLDEELGIIPHQQNPINIGDKGIRSAGAVFMYQDKFLRVTQDCSSGNYGRALIFKNIKQIDSTKYKENYFCTLKPSQINVNDQKKMFEGIHTFNQTEKYEVINLKVKRRNNIFAKLNILFWLLKRYIGKRVRRMMKCM